MQSSKSLCIKCLNQTYIKSSSATVADQICSVSYSKKDKKQPNLIIMSNQIFGDHRSMFSKQILPNIYLGTYKGIAKKGTGVFNRKTQKNRGTNLKGRKCIRSNIKSRQLHKFEEQLKAWGLQYVSEKSLQNLNAWKKKKKKHLLATR